jgi:putative oxidoreductase
VAHLLEVLMPYTPYLALVLRVWLGATLMIHGRPKLNKQNREQSVKNFAAQGVPAVAVFLGMVIEFFGGLFLVIGFIVPVVGAIEAIYFANIVAVKKTKQNAVYVGYGKPNFELEVFFVMAAVVLVFLGAGVLSLDGLIGL